MAIQDKSLASAEHDWFATRSGLSAHAPLNDHKYTYFAGVSTASINGDNPSLVGNASIRRTLDEIERQWLASIPTVTPPNNIGVSDLWSRALGNMGITPTVNLTENKRLFFSTVTVYSPIV